MTEPGHLRAIRDRPLKLSPHIGFSMSVDETLHISGDRLALFQDLYHITFDNFWNIHLVVFETMHSEFERGEFIREPLDIFASALNAVHEACEVLRECEDAIG